MSLAVSGHSDEAIRILHRSGLDTQDYLARCSQAWSNNVTYVQESLLWCDLAVRSDPASPITWFHKGRGIEEFGEAAEALAAYQQALVLYDVSDYQNCLTATCYHIGQIYEGLAQWDQASVAYQRAIDSGACESSNVGVPHL